MARYDFAAIEKKWQAYWAEHGTFRQANPGEHGFAELPKFYVLDMFPYPSGAGLHVGHPEGYTATDIVARYKRMRGFNVLHPIGYDAFGLPAEQYAVEHGVHPRVTTERNIANIERQIKSLGFSYDWSRRVATTDVEYYRWTQWIFLQIFNSWCDPERNQARPIGELISRLQNGQLVIGFDGQIKPTPDWQKIPEFALMAPRPGEAKFYNLTPAEQREIINDQRLAYLDEVPVNWCPMLGTVLANEEVTNEGRSERGDHPVYRRALKQWMLRITAYAERLLEDLDLVDWPEPIKAMQRNWIGKSEGAEVDFPVEEDRGTAFQAVPNAEFKRVAGLPESHRPVLWAKSCTPCDPFPKEQPSPPERSRSRRNLPHVQVPGATYFVTFRVHDVPLSEEERGVVLNAILFWHGQRCVVYGAVVMDTHAHMLVRPLEAFELSDILHSIKGFTGREINLLRQCGGHVWQDESFDHIVRDGTWFNRFLWYVCLNPTVRKTPTEPVLAQRFDEYRWLFVNEQEVSTDAPAPFGHSLEGCATKDEWFTERREYGFPVPPEDHVIRVYTTRPDTLYGATYMVLAPEHPLVEEITTPQQRQVVQAYVEAAARKSELERTADTKEKTGVFTGACAINPVTREPIPIWVADYVLMGYGTGAIMAVPAHDTRDYEFARKYNLAVKTVVLPVNDVALRVPVATSYEYAGPIEKDPSAEELDAIAKSIVDEFRNGNLYQVAAPVGRVRVMLSSGKVLCTLAGNELRKIHDSVDPEAFKVFSGLVWQRAQETQESFIDDGVAINSAHYDGLPTLEFKKRITEDIAQAGLGRGAVNYKLRDWLFSRQRYWGEPFPIVHCPACGVVALPEDRLPLELPEMDDFTPSSSSDPDALPQPPLGKALGWMNTTCPSCGGPAQRELNTMPQWAGSCWYYLRYLDPRNAKRFCDPKVEKYWMSSTEGKGQTAGKMPEGREGETPPPRGGIDLYVGGAEHAVLHLLYSRFWHKVLYDLGFVSTPEPFGRLFNQGMIRSFAYRDKRGVYIGYDEIDFTGERPRHKKTGEELSENVEKMSKSLKNVVNPDEVLAEYGADTFRLYEMFMGPLEASKPWNTRDVPGVHRFLNRVWRMIVGDEDSKSLLGGTGFQPVPEVEKALHKLIKKAGEDIEAMKFNTPIAAMMEFVNAVYKAGTLTKDQAERFVLVLAPFAPHVAEELWQTLGHNEGLSHEPWPQFDPAMIAEDAIELAVQVNGKVKAKITVPAGASKEECLAAAKADAKVAAALAGKTIVKEIVAAGRLVNLVVK